MHADIQPGLKQNPQPGCLACDIRFEVRDRYLHAQVLNGEVTHELGLECWRRIASECERCGGRRVLVENRLRGQMSLLETYYVARTIPAMSGFQFVRIALLDTRGLDFARVRFGENVAVNRGAMVRAFQEPAAAVDWLVSDPLP